MSTVAQVRKLDNTAWISILHTYVGHLQEMDVETLVEESAKVHCMPMSPLVKMMRTQVDGEIDLRAFQKMAAEN